MIFHKQYTNIVCYLIMLENMDFTNLLMMGGIMKGDSSHILIFTLVGYLFSYCSNLTHKMKLENQIREKLTSIFNYIFNSQYVSIELVSHKVPCTVGYSDKPVYKNVFSPSFLAILHYLKTNRKTIEGVSNSTEILINKIAEISLPSWRQTDTQDDKFLLIPDESEPVCICKQNNIFLQISMSNCTNEENTANKAYEMKLFTYADSDNIDLKKRQLYEFVELQKTQYEAVSQKKDDKLLIFQYKGSVICDDEMTMKYESFPMEHNKDLNTNIFFEGKQKILEYITPFVYKKDQTSNPGESNYIRSGITFKAGILFHGAPGCGKTTTIKGILKYCNRNAVIVNLSNIKTNDELEGVFRNCSINGKEYSGKELCFILEDCDATRLSSLSDRNDTSSIVVNKDIIKQIKQETTSADSKTETNTNNNANTNADNSITLDLKSGLTNIKGFDLSCFLNILDGIIELHGVMIIMTSNHPEKLDPALIRPGRIDFKYQFKKATKQILFEMLKLRYEKTDEEIKKYFKKSRFQDYVLSPAQIQSICFQNATIETCIQHITREIELEESFPEKHGLTKRNET